MFDLPRSVKVLILVSVAITIFLSFASVYVKASARGERRAGRKMAGPLLMAIFLLVLLGIAFAYDFGLVVLGAFVVIGIVVYVLYVIPKRRIRRRYM